MKAEKSVLFKEVKPHIAKAFWKFHKENPEVFKLVKKFAYEAVESGRERFGIGMIWERIRWYTMIETSGKPFKLSNDHRSCYARLLMTQDPEFVTFFSRKVSRKN